MRKLLPLVLLMAVFSAIVIPAAKANAASQLTYHGTVNVYFCGVLQASVPATLVITTITTPTSNATDFKLDSDDSGATVHMNTSPFRWHITNQWGTLVNWQKHTRALASDQILGQYVSTGSAAEILFGYQRLTVKLSVTGYLTNSSGQPTQSCYSVQFNGV